MFTDTFLSFSIFINLLIGRIKMAKKREREIEEKNRRNDKTDIGAEIKPANPGKPVSLRWAAPAAALR